MSEVIYMQHKFEIFSDVLLLKNRSLRFNHIFLTSIKPIWHQWCGSILGAHLVDFHGKGPMTFIYFTSLKMTAIPYSKKGSGQKQGFYKVSKNGLGTIWALFGHQSGFLMFFMKLLNLYSVVTF